MSLCAYFDNRLFRRDFLCLLRDHTDRGVCVRGTCGSFMGPLGTWQGTAVVCALRCVDILQGYPPRTWSSEPDDLADALGIPRELVRAFDWVFENIPNDDVAHSYPLRFFEAIPLGANLSTAWLELLGLFARTVPTSLGILVRRQGEAETIEDSAWDPYRQPDGLGIPGAAAIAEALLYVLQVREPRVTRCVVSQACRQKSVENADTLLRKICSA